MLLYFIMFHKKDLVFIQEFWMSYTFCAIFFLKHFPMINPCIMLQFMWGQDLFNLENSVIYNFIFLEPNG